MNLNGFKMFGGILYMSLAFLCLVRESIADNNINETTTDFAKYRISHPTLYHGRTKREISTTRNDTGFHHSSVTLIVPVDDEELILDLELNDDLVPEEHTLEYQEGGKIVQHTTKKEELDLCHYHGSVRGKSNSWAAVSTCHGISGVIFDGNRTRYIEPAQGSNIRTEHFLYDHHDLQSTRHCGNHNKANKKVDSDLMMRQKQKLRSRQYMSYINRGQETNLYPRSRYVELVLVADYTMFMESGSDVRAVQSFMISLVNIMNTLYAPLNVKIALVRVVVWNGGDEIPVNQDSAISLQNLVYYKQTRLANIQHDHVQLLTGQAFYKNILGLAYVRAICGASSASVASYSYFKAVPERVAITLAHELGHSLGMEHDDNYCQCARRTCVMYPSDSGDSNNQWSSCSINALTQLFMSGEDQCLFNKPQRMWNSV